MPLDFVGVFSLFLFFSGGEGGGGLEYSLSNAQMDLV